jgi:integrase
LNARRARGGAASTHKVIRARPARSKLVRALPIAEWPAADRDCWNRACEPGARLTRGGLASHLAPVTRNDLASRYGYFLDCLKRASILDHRCGPAAQVTPAKVDAYLAELRARVSSVTVYGSIQKLRRAAELIAPKLDFVWLSEIEKDLALVMIPRSKFDRVVLTEVLVEAGLTLIAEAEASGRSDLVRARGVRNGLMVALLALCPIRLKNFAALEIGKTIMNSRGAWWIVLPYSMTKSRRADERRVPDVLNAVFETYVDRYRPMLLREGRSTNALWVSSHDGAAMSYVGVEVTVKGTTRSAIGVDVCPHMFRTAAASTAAIHCGNTPHLASAILQHTDPRVTEEHYNRATCMSAAQAYAAIANSYRRA